MTRRALLGGLVAVPLLGKSASAASTSTSLEPLALATAWLGDRPSASSLHGRVVLVDVFTFECINCVRVTPNLKRLYATYPRGEFEIIAVHTPEVPSYQRRMSYVAGQARSAQLPWPIALDNDHRIWDAYGVSGWPTQLVFDRSGRLRNTIVGDSQDDELNNAIKALLRG